MKNNLSYDNLVARAYATVKTGDFLPVGIIALGGTGCRIAREIKVRTNKNGTRWARVSIKGKQHVIRV